MPVAVEVVKKQNVPSPVDPPQTFESALRCFRCEIKKMKKEDKKAGGIERRIQKQSKALLREAARKAYQDQAGGCSPHCPICGTRLVNVEMAERSIHTQWGSVTFHRAYGKCPNCGKYFAPADHHLGLPKGTQTSPDMAEKLTWLNTLLPSALASEVFEHITGQPVSPSKVERGSKKKAKEALKKREEDLLRSMTPDEKLKFSSEYRLWDEPSEFTLVITIDGWMVRERDEWGKTEFLRRQGVKPKRWHEVKTLRIFRLDSRSCTEKGRPILLNSHYLATRKGPEVFSEFVYMEAVRMGLFRAREVLFVADGAVWIWNIAKDRFTYAKGVLDFYHASSHLWSVANQLFGEGTQEARTWVAPLIHQLRHGEHDRVLKTLSDLSYVTRELPIGKEIERENRYFENHRDHVNYEETKNREEPIGSGAVESACKQYQMRFKRPGQFWNREMEEGLLELVNRRNNGLWHTLWPHILSEN